MVCCEVIVISIFALRLIFDIFGCPGLLYSRLCIEPKYVCSFPPYTCKNDLNLANGMHLEKV